MLVVYVFIFPPSLSLSVSLSLCLSLSLPLSLSLFLSIALEFHDILQYSSYYEQCHQGTCSQPVAVTLAVRKIGPCCPCCPISAIRRSH